MTNKEDILKNLQTISSASGREFLNLSDCFPVLIQEISASEKQTAQKNNWMRHFSELQDNFIAMLQKYDQTVKTNQSVIQTIHTKNTKLFTSFSEGMQMLKNMNNIISQIKDESMEMEIISLNAMVVSIKSGREGQAFSYITSNLKRLSLNLIASADALMKDETAVQAAINHLSEAIDKVSGLDSGEENSGGLEQTNLMAVINDITQSLSDIQTASKTVKTPIMRAMEGIQTQDIVRQSLDDISLVISQISDEDLSSDPEAKYEQLSANCQLSELAEKCLSHIKEHLEKSIECFDKNRIEITSILDEIETRRKNFISRTINGSETTASLQSCIDAAGDNFAKFAELCAAYQKGQHLVQERVFSIQDEVRTMQNCIESFNPIITNLQYVAIAQRIEVARNEAISSIHSTVEHMSDLITQTNRNIENAQQMLQDFTDTITIQSNNFADDAAKNKVLFDTVISEKNTCTDNMQFMQNELVSSLSRFSVYSQDFMDRYEKICASISAIKELISLCLESQSMLQDMHSQYEAKKNEHAAAYNLQDKPVQNDALQAFLNRFTIMTDKHMVASIGGINIDNGVEAGEITLF
ncbi:MAG: hypothetical protein NC041_06735 [Bacteroides sp.]|nr:hypothetical protein [Prevotella sp.]MCM1406992.1 hypothetical protein [Treponema brennaborense]MCM1470143.1 hypothetical protein [Bacteroides sp.]